MSVGRRGSMASARRAIAWYGDGLKATDRLRVRRNCDHMLAVGGCRCTFLCRGCLRWTPWAEGGCGSDTAADYACDPCANAVAKALEDR